MGRKPFEGDDPFALATAIRTGEYEPSDHVVPDVDPTIAAVIERAMRLDPRDRYESAEAMAAALLDDDDAAAAEATVAPAPIAAEEPQRRRDTTRSRTGPRPSTRRPRTAARLPPGAGAAADSGVVAGPARRRSWWRPCSRSCSSPPSRSSRSPARIAAAPATRDHDAPGAARGRLTGLEEAVQP